MPRGAVLVVSCRGNVPQGSGLPRPLPEQAAQRDKSLVSSGWKRLWGDCGGHGLERQGRQMTTKADEVRRVQPVCR